MVEVPHINDDRVVELAQRLKPDVIAVFGTSLIRGPLLGMGRLGMVNLHGGLSPEYRGADCTFWALYNGEPEKVGCTLHYIDAGIDTGKLIAHVSPAVKRGDDELTLFWRAVRDSAEVYGELFERLGRGVRLGRAQPGKGRLYQVKDRGLKHERALERRLAEGMLDRVDLPMRVTWFECGGRHGGEAGSGEGFMRDIAITLAVFGSLPFILARPWIGILVWTWLGFMNPHRLAWGFSVTMPFAMIVALTTLVAIFLSREPKRFSRQPEMILMLVFLAWMLVTTVMAYYPALAWEQFDKVWKIFLMIFVATLVINTKERLQALVWVIALSIGFLRREGRPLHVVDRRRFPRSRARWDVHRRQQRDRPGALHDSAAALLPAADRDAPLVRNLHCSERYFLQWLQRLGPKSAARLSGWSRSGAFLWLKSRQKVQIGLLIAFSALVLVPFMPEAWVERMQSIRHIRGGWFGNGPHQRVGDGLPSRFGAPLWGRLRYLSAGAVRCLRARSHLSWQTRTASTSRCSGSTDFPGSRCSCSSRATRGFSASRAHPHVQGAIRSSSGCGT